MNPLFTFTYNSRHSTLKRDLYTPLPQKCGKMEYKSWAGQYFIRKYSKLFKKWPGNRNTNKDLGMEQSGFWNPVESGAYVCF